jgi:enoyl-CoA hydratase/carnithine racemase
VELIGSGDITVGIDASVVTVTFNRPAKRNALTQAMYEVAADTLEAADADAGIGAVVFTGTGSAFTAGNDLGAFASGASLEQVGRFLRAIASVRVPVVAAVNGIAVGVGLTMLLHCDLVFVEPGATLSVPFVDLGLVPEGGSSLLLPRAIGTRRAAELFFTGRRITGTEATEWGLANATASPVLATAVEAARRLAAQPPNAVRTTKALLRSDERSIEGRMEEEMGLFEAALRGAEFAEVIAARSEGRPAAFVQGGR